MLRDEHAVRIEDARCSRLDQEERRTVVKELNNLKKNGYRINAYRLLFRWQNETPKQLRQEKEYVFHWKCLPL
jgi:hypothetical protein